MKRKLILAVGFLVFPLLASADHLICVSTTGTLVEGTQCAQQTTRAATVAAADVARKFAYINRRQRHVIVGVLPPGATKADISVRPMFATDIRLGPKAADGTIMLHEKTLGRWTLHLQAWWFEEERLNISMPAGTYDVSIQVGGEQIFERKDWTLRDKLLPRSVFDSPEHDPRRKVILTGRAITTDGTAAPFAQISADCKSIVCEADANGAFRCDVRVPRTSSFCIEHPRFGRKRVELEGRIGTVELGPVTLIAGATVQVIKPPHVELPAKTMVSLYDGDREIVAPVEIGARELVELTGLAGGRYDVLLSGPRALQRKLFPVEVMKEGMSEVTLSLDAFRLEGSVEFKESPLAEAAIKLDAGRWRAPLATDDLGRFSEELWQPYDYAVRIESGALTQPHMIMKHASPSDSHWQIVVPSRRLTGTVVDAQSERPVRDAALSIDSDSESTHWSRTVLAEADGTFDLTGIGDGRYTVTARAPGYLPTEPRELKIARGDGDRDLRIPMVAGATIETRVVDGAGAPVAGALLFVGARPDGGVSGLIRASADGVAMLTLASGATETVFALSDTGSIGVTRVSAKQHEKGVTIVVPPAVATLALRATTKDAAPLAGIGVGLRFQGERVPDSLLLTKAEKEGAALATNAGGDLTIARLPAGRYELAWRARGQRGFADAWRPMQLPAGITRMTQTFSVAEEARASSGTP